jgi:dienelactone hydrolase
MELRVHAPDGLVDELPQVGVVGAPEGERREFEVTVTDADGHRWRSRGERFEERLFWDMDFASEGSAPTAFVAPPDQLRYELRARCGREASVAHLIRRWSAVGVEPRELSGDGFAGTLFSPAGGAGGGVLVLPGSTGRRAMEPMGALLASHGYVALVAAYMQEPGLPRNLEEIPVEVVGRALSTLEAETGPAAAIAASVGTQGMLAALAHGAARPTRAVAIAPSSVVWQALPADGRPPRTAAWSHGGQPLPWLAIHGERIFPEIVKHGLLDRLSRNPRPRALHMLPAYAPSLRKPSDVERAAIPVERIECPLLLLSGDQDAMWPGASMAKMIEERRGGGDKHDRSLTFAQAGHFLRPPITPTTVPWNDELVSGGSAEGNARAQAEGWAAILTFLEQN